MNEEWVRKAMLAAWTQTPLCKAIYSATTREQQEFATANLQKLPELLATEEGKIALQTFIEDLRTISNSL